MGTHNTEWKFLITTAFIVATVAVPTLGSLLSPEDIENKAVISKSQDQKMRDPASIPDLGTPKSAAGLSEASKELSKHLNDNAINFDFKCSKAKTNEFKVQGAYVQLKGHDCDKSADAPKLSITNKTNGFTASVFANGKEYQTDLIQLKEGDNQIHIQYQYSSGQTEEHVLNVKSGNI